MKNKPITKKYHSKDLNIAYNDGLEEGRQKALSEELEFLERWYSGKGTIERRIAKIKKELGK